MNKEQAVTDYYKMAASIAHKYDFTGNDFEDLYQVALLELSKAADNYNPDFNTKFSSYAYIWMQGAALKYVRENKSIKFSADLVSINKTIQQAIPILTQELMSSPTDDELALYTGIPKEKIIEAKMALEPIRSLDYELTKDEKPLTFYDSVGYNEIGYDSDIIDLKSAVNNLQEPARSLIISRYYRGNTQQETSDILGMSQVQISRHEKKALTKLRKDLAS